MHHINREDLLASEVMCSVKSRILEYERERSAGGGPGWRELGEEVPRDMVPNRISEYERLIQKSKSMPNLGKEALSEGGTPASSRRSSCPKHRFSIEFLLDEDPPSRNPPEGEPQCPGGRGPAPVHIQVTDGHGIHAAARQDYSDSDREAGGSDLSDFIQVEGSSFCSESDLDHCSLTSSESFCGSGYNPHHHHPPHHHQHQHHHHHRQLVSSCKGHCPASYTRFTTMVRHERARQEGARHLKAEDPDSGLSKLAFLVSPVPFRRKRGPPPQRRAPRPKSKSSMYEALDSALKDIYDHIRAEKRRGSLPDSSILHRLLLELLPDVPERGSSLRALSGRRLDPPHHPQPDGVPGHAPYPPESSRLAYGASSYRQHADSSSRNHGNANVLTCYQDKDASRGYSYPEVGRHTPQNRRPTPDREKQPARAIYDFKAQTAKELNFKKGETVLIIRQIDKNWYEGELRGRVGIFPISYVEKILPTERNQPARPPPPAQAREIGKPSPATTSPPTLTWSFLSERETEWSCYGSLLSELEALDPAVPDAGRRGADRRRYLASPSFSSSPASPMFGGSGDIFTHDAKPAPDRKEVGLAEAQASHEPIDLMVREPIQGPSFNSEPFSKDQEEELCEELLSIIQGSQSQGEFSREEGFYRQAPDITEELPLLYIEEDPIENSRPDALFKTISPVQSEGTKAEPALRREVIVVGKPPRSPVLSRRSCGSPVKGQSFSPAHRSQRSAYAQDALHCQGEPFQAIYNYTPRNEDELELKEGDVVDVMEKCDDGWFVGTSRRSKFFGTFPGNYVKRL
ncbi:hypothetical protein ANANG_G00134140 [Anguilla anguilla]|uniref:Osteoclast-stimulating factor 1 n=1 Tax=Anguilla anguilla TaxID=7936 RepID=A0A9D3MBB3_ANGAN|nr:hypothetical protein ANANG_G00134140 [Anguilla anguilla]